MTWFIIAFTAFLILYRYDIFIATIVVGIVGILYALFGIKKDKKAVVVDIKDFSSLSEKDEPVYIQGTVHGRKILKSVYDDSDCILSMKKFQPMDIKFGIAIHLYNDSENVLFQPDSSNESLKLNLSGDIDAERLLYGIFSTDSPEFKKCGMAAFKDVDKYIISEDVLRENDKVIVLGKPVFNTDNQLIAIDAEKVILDNDKKRVQMKTSRDIKSKLVGCLSAALIFGVIFLRLIVI